MGGHVFISYSRDDGGYVAKLTRFLGSQGVPVWIDENIDYGEAWATVVCERIDSCAAFVPVMTPHAERSTWVAREIARAESMAKPAFPLLLDGEPFFRLAHLQYEDVTGQAMPRPRFVQRLRQLAAGHAGPASGSAAAGHAGPASGSAAAGHAGPAPESAAAPQQVAAPVSAAAPKPAAAPGSPSRTEPRPDAEARLRNRIHLTIGLSILPVVAFPVVGMLAAVPGFVYALVARSRLRRGDSGGARRAARIAVWCSVVALVAEALLWSAIETWG